MMDNAEPPSPLSEHAHAVAGVNGSTMAYDKNGNMASALFDNDAALGSLWAGRVAGSTPGVEEAAAVLNLLATGRSIYQCGESLR